MRILKTNNHHSNLGYFYISLCCISSAASFVFISHLNNHYSVLLSLTMTFGYAIILFTLWNYKHLKSMWSIAKSEKSALIMLNIATLFSWFGTFMALKYIDPATKISIGFGLIAVTNFFISVPLRKVAQHKHLLYCILFVILNMILVLWQFSVSNQHATTENIIIGISWAVVGGVIGGFIGINSQKLNKAGYNATQVLATRFYLLVIMSVLLLVLTDPTVSFAHIRWKYYLLSTALVVLLPLLFYHLAIENIGSLIVSFIEAFTPVITYFLQIIFLRFNFNWLSMCLIILSSIGIVILVRTEHKERIKKSQEDIP